MTAKQESVPKQQLREIESNLVEIITGMGYLKGRSKKMAEIVAYITIRKEVTQKLLRELTSYSLGSVSSTLQSLENIGFLQKHKDPNSREYLYKYEESYTEPQSRSMGNVFEYFSQLENFLTEIEKKLDKTGFKEKKGYENVKSFVSKMKILFPAVKQALSTFTKNQTGRDNQ